MVHPPALLCCFAQLPDDLYILMTHAYLLSSSECIGEVPVIPSFCFTLGKSLSAKVSTFVQGFETQVREATRHLHLYNYFGTR